MDAADCNDKLNTIEKYSYQKNQHRRYSDIYPMFSHFMASIDYESDVKDFSAFITFFCDKIWPTFMPCSNVMASTTGNYEIYVESWRLFTFYYIFGDQVCSNIFHRLHLDCYLT